MKDRKKPQFDEAPVRVREYVRRARGSAEQVLVRRVSDFDRAALMLDREAHLERSLLQKSLKVLRGSPDERRALRDAREATTDPRERAALSKALIEKSLPSPLAAEKMAKIEHIRAREIEAVAARNLVALELARRVEQREKMEATIQDRLTSLRASVAAGEISLAEGAAELRRAQDEMREMLKTSSVDEGQAAKKAVKKFTFHRRR